MNQEYIATKKNHGCEQWTLKEIYAQALGRDDDQNNISFDIESRWAFEKFDIDFRADTIASNWWNAIVHELPAIDGVIGERDEW
jgi:hypothetical protein